MLCDADTELKPWIKLVNGRVVPIQPGIDQISAVCKQNKRVRFGEDVRPFRDRSQGDNTGGVSRLARVAVRVLAVDAPKGNCSALKR